MRDADEPFLSRWSRLKRTPPRKPADGPATSTETGTDGGGGEQETEQASPAQPAGQASPPSSVVEPAKAGDRPDFLEQVKAIDIDALDAKSDFTPFMQSGVPDELRNKALRKLWQTDPIFGHIDGLDDYCEDFSDAVWASPGLKTAYKVGRGFLSDAEVAEWDRLGKPAQEPDSGVPESQGLEAGAQRDAVRPEAENAGPGDMRNAEETADPLTVPAVDENQQVAQPSSQGDRHKHQS
ncbi:MAG: DUF3306 domain-containing protein [Hyphomicrobiaceae bacterium]